MDKLSRDFAAYLQGKLGVKKGDRIAVMSPNLLAFPIAFLGIVRAGAAQVNVNPLYTPRELRAPAQRRRCRDHRRLQRRVGHGGRGAWPRRRLKTVITTGVGDGSGVCIPSPPVDARLTGAVAWPTRWPKAPSCRSRRSSSNGDDLLFLQYTGGTTGLSKGAALSHRNLVANVEQFKAFMPDACGPGRR